MNAMQRAKKCRIKISRHPVKESLCRRLQVRKSKFECQLSPPQEKGVPLSMGILTKTTFILALLPGRASCVTHQNQEGPSDTAGPSCYYRLDDHPLPSGFLIFVEGSFVFRDHKILCTISGVTTYC
ncbi:uncharacterized protein LOC113949401 [Corapipo altera]|uniref:uncharacterized protein LOC113949401 n=1 Tax=Corapipo altera TaxID=415028 RepID=UPI000FD656A7|nr:uncharacterized protein LOC113949401 [Corapipo altera]